MTATATRSEHEPKTPRDLSPWVIIGITVILNLVAVAGMFASVKTTSDEHTQQIRELQQNSVQRREFDGVTKRLERIEDKLDRALEGKR